MLILALQAQVKRVFDHFVGQSLGAQVEPQPGMGLPYGSENVVPEGLDFLRLQPALVVHAELNRVDFGEDFEEPLEGRLVVVREVLAP